MENNKNDKGINFGCKDDCAYIVDNELHINLSALIKEGKTFTGAIKELDEKMNKENQ